MSDEGATRLGSRRGEHVRVGAPWPIGRHVPLRLGLPVLLAREVQTVNDERTATASPYLLTLNEAAVFLRTPVATLRHAQSLPQ